MTEPLEILNSCIYKFAFDVQWIFCQKVIDSESIFFFLFNFVIRCNINDPFYLAQILYAQNILVRMLKWCIHDWCETPLCSIGCKSRFQISDCFKLVYFCWEKSYLERWILLSKISVPCLNEVFFAIDIGVFKSRFSIFISTFLYMTDQTNYA